MRNLFFILFVVLFVGNITTSEAFGKNKLLFNRIEGQVYDQNRNPVSEIYVELLNSVNSTLGRTRTNGAGRFFFVGMPSGRYTVSVLALGKGLLSDTQDVEISNQNSRSDIAFVDFYLRPDKKASSSIQEGIPETVFVQDTPEDAVKLYESGIKDLDNGKDAGIPKLEKAVAIFPEYFAALSRLGKESVNKKEYEKAYQYLLRAIDVNPRSLSTYYSLSFAFYQLGEIPAALKAAEACVVLNAGVPAVQLLYGTLLRLDKSYEKSEKALLKAKSLANNPIPEIHWQLALLYNKLNRNKEAADELTTYLKLYPDSPGKKKIQELINKLKKGEK